MMKFLARLLGGVARGLGWAARMAILVPLEIGESMWTAIWRQLFPPPVEAEESTAEVLREVATMIAGRETNAEVRAQTERPAPKPAPAATVRRRMERALAYTDAYLRGERLPSLDHVGAELAHELRRIRSVENAESLHRQLMQGLGMEAANWVRPRREVLLPGPDHDDGLTPCPT